MNLDEAIIIKKFSSRIEAEMAAGLLASEGVPALVLADDAGGAYPSLQFVRGVRLLVAAGNLNLLSKGSHHAQPRP